MLSLNRPFANKAQPGEAHRGLKHTRTCPLVLQLLAAPNIEVHDLHTKAPQQNSASNDSAVPSVYPPLQQLRSWGWL